MDEISVFTIFKRPEDYPDAAYLVRRFNVTRIGTGYVPVPGEILGTADTLDEARTLLPPWAVNMGREDGDHPVIVETWV